MKMSHQPVEQNAASPLPWLLLLPILPAILGIGMAEAGLRWISSGTELHSAAIWMCQTMITGYITILLLTAWGDSFCSLRWRNHTSIRPSLALAAAWASIGWTAWMMVRIVGMMGEEALVPILIFSSVTLATTVAPLWHAIHKLRHPRRSIRLVLGFVVYAIGLQCWAIGSTVEDPTYMFVVNSALIAGAVTVWLVALSLPRAGIPVFQPQ